MSWFKRQGYEIQGAPDKASPDKAGLDKSSADKTVRTEGLWTKCPGCKQFIFKADVEANQQVCPKCDYHFRLDARGRIASLLEPGYELVDLELTTTDPLEFATYRQKLAKTQAETGLQDAAINANGKLGRFDVVLSALEFAFIGGSVGTVVGEMLARAIDRSLDARHPLIIVSASGGARMQEGITSLMQLAKVAAGLARMDDEGVPFISVLTDPTFGGVSASFAMLGDLNIAEPGALIGFTGARVIEQTLRTKLPEGFQRSEFLLEHGMLDAVVPRKELKAYIERAIEFMTPQ